MSATPKTVNTPEAAADRSKRKLGRGLGALLGETQREESVVSPEGGTTLSEGTPLGEGTNAGERIGLAKIPVSRIEPLPDQPRKVFDDEALDELARSIAQRGVI